MVRKTTKKELIEVVKAIRLYGNRMLDGLKDNEVTWIPENTKGRSIQSYIRHLLNSEAYWYKMIKDENFNYFPGKSSFNELVDSFKEYEAKILELIENVNEDDLNIRLPEWGEKKYQDLKQRGSLAWKIWRTSMHAIHHFAQIAYIRFALENPPVATLEGNADPWGYIMDKLVFSAHSDD